MIRLVKVAKDVAVKARTSAIISLKQVLVNAPLELREQLQPLTKMTLIRRCAALQPGQIIDTTTAAKHTIRAIAKRWLALDAEIKNHEQILNQLTSELVPRPGRSIRHRRRHRRRDAHRRRRQPRTRPLRSSTRQALRCRAHPSLLGHEDQAPPESWGSPTGQRSHLCTVIVRLQYQPTQAYYTRRSAEGRTKAEIIRYLKRLLAREIWAHLRPLRQARRDLQLVA
jgi:hypothetical protein